MIPRARSLTWRRAPEPSDCLRIWEPSRRSTTSLKGSGMADARHSHEQDFALFRPILQTGKAFYLVAGALGAVAVWAIFAWLYQLTHGLGATGLTRPIYWGLYITNFVFFIGISHAGTLISAILRLCHAEWRRAITRAAEVITVLVLFFGVGSIIMDLGRPDRVLNVVRHANFTSPLLWDVASVTTYLLGSILYLYLPLIPDVAILRDHLPHRRWLYGPLALGWTGPPRQQRAL